MKTWKSGHMNRIYASIEDLVGSTPLFEPVRVEKQLHLTSHLLCKLEGLNPAGSIKDRAALSMLQAAEADGTLSPGDTIVEQTSGNTGIALASMAIPRGYHCEIFLESGVTPERRTILRALGCHLLDYRDVPGAADPDAPFDPFREATLEEIRRYCTAMGPSFHFLDQTSNPANPQAHIRSTGPEIWKDTDGCVDALVLMAGTGGTLCGLSTYLRKKNPKIHIAAVEPSPCSVRSEENPSCKIIDGVLRFDDRPDAACSSFLHHDLYDECMEVSAESAHRTALLIARQEGLLFGTSGAAALTAAMELSKRPLFAGKNIVVIIPDGGGKYLSSFLYSDQA